MTAPQISHGNLPAPLTSFIGRQRELDEVETLLSENRLVTISGPGGSGKTRLSIQLAHAHREDYQDGIWLVELAPISAGELVAQAVAASLNIREKPGQSISAVLVSELRPLDLLLLLDNCEHLIEECARLAADLLQACPDLKLLTTSREPLGVPGEVVWSLPPMSLPDPRPWRGPEAQSQSLAPLEQSEAVQLFVARAQEAWPTFELQAENAGWVAEVCRRLDGIPLAIELAAARMRAFTPRQIAERLDDRFQLLTSTKRTLPARHRALEATMDWSYQLLGQREQLMLQRLSVFVGGWTLPAAEAVCSSGDINTGQVADLFSSLVDRSLVTAEPSGDRLRYRLLESIREYARQRLIEDGDPEPVRDQHLRYFAEWAETANAGLTGPDQEIWLQRFKTDHDNLRSALDWSLTSDTRLECGLRLGAACGFYWRLHGFLTEGRERLAALLDRSDPQNLSLARGWSLLWAANLAYLQTDAPAVKSLAGQALEVCRQLGPDGRSGVARALDLLGEIATEIGDYHAAPPRFQEALQIYRDLGERRGEADMLLQLGWAAMRIGDYDQADKLLNESLPIFEELGESSLVALALGGLGELSIRQGNLERALELLERSLALRRALGDRWGIAGALGSLGWEAMLARDFDRMRDLLETSLEIRMEIGDQGGIAWCLEKLAFAAFRESNSLPASYRRPALERSVKILAGAAAMRAPINSSIDEADQSDHEEALRGLTKALGDTAFGASWSAGESLSMVDLVNLALTPVAQSIDPELLSDAQAAKIKYGGLTPREREAAVLIAHGRSNREVAQKMVVREKTVETYVTRILNKLGFESRVQIATWAIEVGLLESGDS